MNMATIPSSALPVRFTTDLAPSIEELRQRFSAALRWASEAAQAAGGSMTYEWTDFVLDWWSAAARSSNFAVDMNASRPDVDWAQSWSPPSRGVIGRRGAGVEFMLDLCVTTYAAYTDDFYTQRYWDGALRGEDRREVLIAFESEWGSAGSPPLNRARVLEDALKLIHVQAKLKVLCFGVKSGNQEGLLQDIKVLRARDEVTSADWLLFPVPWDAHPKEGLYLNSVAGRP